MVKPAFPASTGILSLWIAAGVVAQADPKNPVDYTTEVRPVLEKHCFKCHGPEKQKSDVRLDTLSVKLGEDARAAETWHDVRDVINLGEMPPDDEAEMSTGERVALTTWVDHELKVALEKHRGTGGSVVIRRLNRTEYRNTMSDLLGIEADYAANLPPDTPSEDGFKNDGAALSMSPLQLEYYLEAARAGLAHAIVSESEPERFRHEVTETDKDKGKGHWTNQLGAGGEFVARLLKFPDAGDFEIRVKARAKLVEGKGYPRLAGRFGFRADTQAPSGELGVVDVTSEETQEIVFRGRMEQFPIQSRTQSKYPGQLIWLHNAYDDGIERKLTRQVETVTEVKGKKRTKKTTEYIEHEDFPQIIIESVEFEGPLYDQWPPAHHRQLLPPREESGADSDEAYARHVIARFLPRAYRRPVTDGEIDRLLAFFQRVQKQGGSLEDSLRETLAMGLISPDFLYLVEPDPGKAEAQSPLDPFELASRLSYFLWSTMPDERLFALAESGELTKPEVLAAEIDRLLSDERSWSFVEQFTTQWLDLEAVDRVAVNPEYYPDWDNELKPWMIEETRHFFAEVLREDLSALNFIDSEFAMLNEPLGRHYQLDGAPQGTSFERVALADEDPRGGLLTQASVLLGNSTGEDSHPILRAVWLRDRLLDDPPADPPPNVPELNAEDPEFAKLSVREQLEQHREDAACNDCHRGIDPWGIAMEQFDAVGLWRDEIRRKAPRNKGFVSLPVEAATELPGGHALEGAEGLKQYLLEARTEQFARSLVKRLTSYALGRTMEFADEAEVERLTAEFTAEDYRLRPLIHAIVQSEVFQTK